MQESVKKLLSTHNRKDEWGPIMNPPKGSAPALKKGIPLLIQEFDDYLTSEYARQQLVGLRLTNDKKLTLRASFPSLSDFEALLSRLPDQDDSGGSDFAHFVILNLTGGACLRAKDKEVVGIPKWDLVRDELVFFATHWFQFIMTWVVIGRYEYVKALFFSPFTDEDVNLLKEKYVQEIDLHERQLKQWSAYKGQDAEREAEGIRENIRIMQDNLRNATRILQG